MGAFHVLLLQVRMKVGIMGMVQLSIIPRKLFLWVCLTSQHLAYSKYYIPHIVRGFDSHCVPHTSGFYASTKLSLVNNYFCVGGDISRIHPLFFFCRGMEFHPSGIVIFYAPLIGLFVAGAGHLKTYNYVYVAHLIFLVMESLIYRKEYFWFFPI